MIKIEHMDKAVATIQRGDEVISLFTGQIIDAYDLPSLRVTSGTITYSVDETEVVSVRAEVAAPTKTENKTEA